MVDVVKMPPWLLGGLVFVSSAIVSAIIPLLSPVIGGALLVGGLVGYRTSTSPRERGVAVAFLISGSALLIVVLLFAATLMAVNVTHGTPPR